MALSIAVLSAPTDILAFDDSAIVEQCDEKWGSDFSMVKYCRDKQRAAGKAYDKFKSQAEGNQTASVILVHCEDKWRKDYSMVNYCIEKQLTAVQSLATTPENIPSDVEKTIKTQCSAKWGTDFAMVSYCVEKQTDAWRELQ